MNGRRRDLSGKVAKSQHKALGSQTDNQCVVFVSSIMNMFNKQFE